MMTLWFSTRTREALELREEKGQATMLKSMDAGALTLEQWSVHHDMVAVLADQADHASMGPMAVHLRSLLQKEENAP